MAREMEELRQNIDRRARDAKPRGVIAEQRNPNAGSDPQKAVPVFTDITNVDLPGFPALPSA